MEKAPFKVKGTIFMFLKLFIDYKNCYLVIIAKITFLFKKMQFLDI